jgi:RES domain-containing protein
MWRVVRDVDDRSPLDGSRGAGRWNPANLSVLYGAQEPNGAVAEIHHHLSLGEPVFPSRMRHNLFELRIKISETLNFADMNALAKLGVESDRYSEMLYGRTQEIAAAAAYMGFHGIVAPSARWKCQNIILFLDQLGDIDDAIKEVSSAPVNWHEWRAITPPAE